MSFTFKPVTCPVALSAEHKGAVQFNNRYDPVSKLVKIRQTVVKCPFLISIFYYNTGTYLLRKALGIKNTT